MDSHVIWLVGPGVFNIPNSFWAQNFRFFFFYLVEVGNKIFRLRSLGAPLPVAITLVRCLDGDQKGDEQGK